MRTGFKRKPTDPIYKKSRVEFLLANPVCACAKELGCKMKSTDIHHMHGRLGKLLNDQSKWLAVCRQGHDWIGSNISKAREFGWICEKGLWNKQ